MTIITRDILSKRTVLLNLLAKFSLKIILLNYSNVVVGRVSYSLFSCFPNQFFIYYLNSYPSHSCYFERLQIYSPISPIASEREDLMHMYKSKPNVAD